MDKLSSILLRPLVGTGLFMGVFGRERETEGEREREGVWVVGVNKARVIHFVDLTRRQNQGIVYTLMTALKLQKY